MYAGTCKSHLLCLLLVNCPYTVLSLNKIFIWLFCAVLVVSHITHNIISLSIHDIIHVVHTSVAKHSDNQCQLPSRIMVLVLYTRRWDS